MRYHSTVGTDSGYSQHVVRLRGYDPSTRGFIMFVVSPTLAISREHAHEDRIARRMSLNLDLG